MILWVSMVLKPGYCLLHFQQTVLNYPFSPSKNTNQLHLFSQKKYYKKKHLTAQHTNNKQIKTYYF